MLSFMSVPPRSLHPARSAAAAPAGPIFTHDTCTRPTTKQTLLLLLLLLRRRRRSELFRSVYPSQSADTRSLLGRPPPPPPAAPRACFWLDRLPAAPPHPP